MNSFRFSSFLALVLIATTKTMGQQPSVAAGGNDEMKAAKTLQALTQLKAYGGSAFYDTCHLALQKLESGRHTKRVLIVFSDGQDNASKMSFKGLRDELKDSSVTFFAVGLHSDDGNGLAEEGNSILKELSEVSGGNAYFLKDQKAALELADVINAQISQHYTLGFKPLSQTPDQKWHSIKIKLELPKTSDKRPHYEVRYRAGYYSR